MLSRSCANDGTNASRSARTETGRSVITEAGALKKELHWALEGVSPRYLKIGGRWRDHERYALRAEAWRASRQ